MLRRLRDRQDTSAAQNVNRMFALQTNQPTASNSQRPFMSGNVMPWRVPALASGGKFRADRVVDVIAECAVIKTQYQIWC